MANAIWNTRARSTGADSRFLCHDRRETSFVSPDPEPNTEPAVCPGAEDPA